MDVPLILKSLLLFWNLNDLNADKFAAWAALDIIAQASLVCSFPIKFAHFIAQFVCTNNLYPIISTFIAH